MALEHKYDLDSRREERCERLVPWFDGHEYLQVLTVAVFSTLSGSTAMSPRLSTLDTMKFDNPTSRISTHPSHSPTKVGIHCMRCT